MAIYSLIHIESNIRQLIQAKNYEKIIVDLMNESTFIFPGSYKIVEKQSQGECDFVDEENGVKYDAKLLFSNEQCQLLAKGTECLKQWYTLIEREVAEASNNIFKKKMEVRGTTLHIEMEKRLDSVAYDEDAILFIPYPIVPASEKSVFMQFASDILSITYDAIVNDNPEKYAKKRIYIIYPSIIDEKIVLRELPFRKEYLPITSLTPYIKFGLKDFPNENADILYFE